MGQRRRITAGRSFLLEGAEDDPYFQQLGEDTDRALWEYCIRHIDLDSIVIDVGANIGVTSCILADVASQGQVFAVEAGPRNFFWLERNLAGNGLANAHALHRAISDTAGSLRFFENSAYGALAEGILAQGHATIDVPATTLDLMVSELELTRLDLVKVDVEGAEQKVLRGMTETLERLNPTVIIEFNAWALIAHGSVNPLEFIVELLDSFEYVAILQAGGGLQRLHPDEAADFLHAHLMALPQIADLVLRHSGSVPIASAEAVAQHGVTYVEEMGPAS